MARPDPAPRPVPRFLRRIGLGVALAFAAKGLLTTGLIILAAVAGLERL
jgi:hypothetical protein